MIDDRLTEELASRIMRWRVTPDRYIKSGRSWVPRWHFKPLVIWLVRLNSREGTDHYKITCDKGTFSVVTRVNRVW